LQQLQLLLLLTDAAGPSIATTKGVLLPAGTIAVECFSIFSHGLCLILQQMLVTMHGAYVTLHIATPQANIMLLHLQLAPAADVLV
jgi:hypothetical protein